VSLISTGSDILLCAEMNSLIYCEMGGGIDKADQEIAARSFKGNTSNTISEAVDVGNINGFQKKKKTTKGVLLFANRTKCVKEIERCSTQTERLSRRLRSRIPTCFVITARHFLSFTSRCKYTS
jgi:hypothetical protein